MWINSQLYNPNFNDLINETSKSQANKASNKSNKQITQRYGEEVKKKMKRKEEEDYKGNPTQIGQFAIWIEVTNPIQDPWHWALPNWRTYYSNPQ